LPKNIFNKQKCLEKYTYLHIKEMLIPFDRRIRSLGLWISDAFFPVRYLFRYPLREITNFFFRDQVLNAGISHI
jgi:hypothetical protein